MTDIFGRRLKSQQLKGLVDCSSASELMQTYQNLKESWVTRHGCGKEFASYFEKNKLDFIKETMSQNIRSMAGLGFPPEVYNQNANECMNSVLKQDTPRDKKRMTVGEFTNHCRSLQWLVRIRRTCNDWSGRITVTCVAKTSHFSERVKSKRRLHIPSFLMLTYVPLHSVAYLMLKAMIKMKYLSRFFQKIAKFCRSHTQLSKKFLEMVVSCCLVVTTSSLHQVLLTQFFTFLIRQTKANRTALNVCQQ